MALPCHSTATHDPPPSFPVANLLCTVGSPSPRVWQDSLGISVFGEVSRNKSFPLLDHEADGPHVAG